MSEGLWGLRGNGVLEVERTTLQRVEDRSGTSAVRTQILDDWHSKMEKKIHTRQTDRTKRKGRHQCDSLFNLPPVRLEGYKSKLQLAHLIYRQL